MFFRRMLGALQTALAPVSVARGRAGLLAVAAWGVLSASALGQATPEANAVGLDLFRGQVREMLAHNCLACHGGEKTQSEFDLSTREGLLRGGEQGLAIVEGSAEKSRLYRLIAHLDEPHMPAEADKLSDEAIAQVAAWIDAGAPYDRPLIDANAGVSNDKPLPEEARGFWSFQPLAPKAPPRPADAGWARTPIDLFVLARLEAAGLRPNGVADRRTLIRRAYFDLLGLPPTAQEVASFVDDADPEAWPKLIDKLLASPHYGERWARHWLDLARFAESHGYEQDYDRPSAYHYRDFVIQALNDDMPYDRFVRWQLAGDELAPSDPLALKATGFLAAGTHATQITANQAEKERYDELDDLAATIGTSMLGLTLGCARCHDHKYDPLPQYDYYRFIATFTTTVRSDMDVDLNPEQTRLAKEEFARQHAPLVDSLAKFEREQLTAKFDAWLAQGAPLPQPRWLVADNAAAKSEGGATLTKQEDGSFLTGGANPDSDVYVFEIASPLAGVTALRIETLADPSLTKNGPGRAENGNFALSDLRVMAAPADGSAPAAPVKLVNPRATFEQAGLPISAALDDTPASGWAIDPEFGKHHAATFEFETPANGAGGIVLTVTMKFATNKAHAIGRPRVSLSTQPGPAAFDGEQVSLALYGAAQEALNVPADQRTERHKAALLNWFRTTDADWQTLNQAVVEHRRQEPKPVLTKVLVCGEGVPAVRLHTQGLDFYEPTHFLKRGDLRQKQGPATAGFLRVLMRSPEPEKRWQAAPPAGSHTSFRRASMANWIADVDQGAGHLLARVIVNRLWQRHFGRGIVGTPSDFGAQGARPTHPELLDWLAVELVQGGWRLKALHKSMMTSAAYMQSAAYDADRARVDPDNLLLWRRSRKRLEAEAIRDAMLAIGGKLDRTMLGPGSLDEGQPRRSVYYTIKRSQLIPLMMLFDAPDSLQGLAERPTTTIAPQALALMNNPHVRGFSLAFAQRLRAQSGSTVETAARAAYGETLGRAPTDAEQADALAFVLAQAESYRQDGKPNADELALADFCQTLFALNEFVYVE